MYDIFVCDGNTFEYIEDHSVNGMWYKNLNESYKNKIIKLSLLQDYEVLIRFYDE